MRWPIALGVPWLVTAFVAGALLSGGCVALSQARWRSVAGTLVYYGLRRVLGGGGSVGGGILELRGAAVVIGWCAASVASGAAFGMAGAMWRSGGTVHMGRLGARVWCARRRGAALDGRVGRPGRAARADRRARRGRAAAFLITRRRAFVLPVLALTAVVAVRVALTEDGVRDALREVGWRRA